MLKLPKLLNSNHTKIVINESRKLWCRPYKFLEKTVNFKNFKISDPDAEEEDLPEEEYEPLGMISHKKSLITVFGHKHKIKKFINKI